MRFVETPVFTRVIRALIDDESYRALQLALMLRPEQGPVIKGSAVCGRYAGCARVVARAAAYGW